MNDDLLEFAQLPIQMVLPVFQAKKRQSCTPNTSHHKQEKQSQCSEDGGLKTPREAHLSLPWR